jgi:hypothetical protein
VLAWQYSFQAATREAAKTSVSALRRKLSEGTEEARPWWRGVSAQPRGSRLSAAEIGTAHHTFLEFAELARLSSREGVSVEAERLVQAGVLTANEAK